MKTPVRRGINGGKSAEKPKGTQEGFIRSEPVRRQRRPGGRVPARRLVRARIGKRNAESGKRGGGGHLVDAGRPGEAWEHGPF